MIINDSVFGELDYHVGWGRYTTIEFCGKEAEIALMVKGEEDGIFDEEQYLAYQSLVQNWRQLQDDFLHAILDYYKQERRELGYDLEINENYPQIESTGQLLEMIILVGIVVPYGDLYEERDIGITFDCTWDMENGIGIRLLNERVNEVGYQDVAF